VQLDDLRQVDFNSWSKHTGQWLQGGVELERADQICGTNEDNGVHVTPL
jgi:hypothetical protein